MKVAIKPLFASLILVSVIGLSACSSEQSQSVKEESTFQETSGHSHSHAHTHGHDEFDETNVKDRDLAEWKGQWQSGYPYVEDGTLDEVWDYKAQTKGDRTREEYKEYYLKGYKTDVNSIVITPSGSNEGEVEFVRGATKITATYSYDGYGIYKNDEGNPSAARFIFQKKSGDAQTPQYIVFSDHNIEPTVDIEHFHLYWGDDRDALVQERVSWPTYFPSAWSGEEIKESLMD